MRRLATAVLLTLAVAQPALALSCMRPDLVRDFEEAAADPAEWIVVSGALRFDPADLPPAPGETVTETGGGEIAARMEGMALSGEGFTIPFDREITLRLTCAGPWCGSVRPGAHLAFLKHEPPGYTMIVGACPGRVWPDPTPAMEAQLTACMQGDCPATD
ncbi:hypothetical protein [Salipiger mucosus]|uniref:Lipoprotein n=1 Tax=Salipiger mucosus DSM 16094 TaxID=1123237 RepID=S9QIY1_9RHOB|nr:hypothetical protein [Salipiger mucosus]EPX79767.1 hypothetical protein Salmuc_05125 [Salipiger mucosus DSM 16094]